MYHVFLRWLSVKWQPPHPRDMTSYASFRQPPKPQEYSGALFGSYTHNNQRSVPTQNWVSDRKSYAHFSYHFSYYSAQFTHQCHTEALYNSDSFTLDHRRKQNMKHSNTLKWQEVDYLLRAFLLIMSKTRPGVPTTICTPDDSLWRSSRTLVPPMHAWQSAFM